MAPLFAFYAERKEPTIRNCVTVAHIAVILARDQGADRVTPLRAGNLVRRRNELGGVVVMP